MIYEVKDETLRTCHTWIPEHDSDRNGRYGGKNSTGSGTGTGLGQDVAELHRP